MTRKSVPFRGAESVLDPLTIESEMRIAALRAAAAAAQDRPPQPMESWDPIADRLALYTDPLRPRSPLSAITVGSYAASIRQAAQQLRQIPGVAAQARAADTLPALMSPAEARLLLALGGSGRLDRYGIRHFDNPALTPDAGDQVPNWPGMPDAPSPGLAQTDEFGGIERQYPPVMGPDQFGGYPLYAGDSEAPQLLPIADVGPSSPLTAKPSLGAPSLRRESGIPSATAPRFIPAAATMAMPAFGNSGIAAPAAGGGLSAGDALAGLAPWAVAGATGFLTGMFAFMPHSPGPQTGTIPGANLDFTYHPDEGRLTVQQPAGSDGQPGSVVAELRIGSDGTFQTPNGQAAAIRNPDGSFRFGGGFLAGAVRGRMAAPVLPSIESYPAGPESGPHIESYPAQPPLSGPQTETYPALPPAPPSIETFPADSTAGSAQIESFPLPPDLSDSNAMFATAIRNPQGGFDVIYKYMRKWTPEQRRAADEKVAAQNRAAPVTETPVGPRDRSAARIYLDHGGTIPPDHDIDHLRDRQIGGTDDISNLGPLHKSVNRSLGPQLSWIFRRYPGARIDSFRIED